MPLPDFSKELAQIEEEKNNPTAENVEIVVEEKPTNEGLSEDEIFKKQKREKLLAHLAKCREKSAQKRKEKKEEKEKNKKPRGRPKKQEEQVILDDVEVKELPPAEKPPTIQHKIIEKQVQAPQPSVQIDYDRIINGVHDKYLKSKEERKKNKVQPVQAPVQAPVQPAFDRVEFERQIREDERNAIRMRVEQKKQEDRLRQQTKDYYSRLPPRSLASNKNWDEYFFGK